MTKYRYKLVSSREEDRSDLTTPEAIRWATDNPDAYCCSKVIWTNNWQDACDFFSLESVIDMCGDYDKHWYIQSFSDDDLPIIKTIKTIKDVEEHSEILMAERKIATDEGMAEQIIDFHGKFEDMSQETRDEIINPKHYEVVPPEAYSKHPDGLEYMDIMQYLLAHHSGVQAHLLGQIFKYAIRLGQKDAKLQDAKKIQWYANYLVNVIEEEK
jgi:hypothetical protein